MYTTLKKVWPVPAGKVFALEQAPSLFDAFYSLLAFFSTVLGYYS